MYASIYVVILLESVIRSKVNSYGMKPYLKMYHVAVCECVHFIMPGKLWLVNWKIQKKAKLIG